MTNTDRFPSSNSADTAPSIHHRIEEWLNSATHGIGALLSVIGTIALVLAADQLGDVWKIVSFSIFGGSLILLYMASALYHGARHPKLKTAFKTLDHCAIFLLIAGTYTPFLLVNMRGSTGWTLLAIIWSLAITGVVLKVIFKNRFKLARVGIYVAMGWLITFASSDLVANLSEQALYLTIAGGVVYTAGVAFYLADRIPYMHAIWHLFVIGGSALHFSAIYYGVLPYVA
ncbi:hemolysin III family protein [Marinobacter sp. CHS3-4]|uniref:PAQR family membrane homeostasis protein TrhA n=1 Tax=Marinobacter sp. CHS3-4 TaxID=3045174 RepID=UPI0024B58BCC|nr:hemolysin III family protein [Marinobacter sp. CHS3-4]MDI9244486.1 hemolysin III family protein [Marinobacter sp. CHS3-4]